MGKQNEKFILAQKLLKQSLSVHRKGCLFDLAVKPLVGMPTCPVGVSGSNPGSADVHPGRKRAMAPSDMGDLLCVPAYWFCLVQSLSLRHLWSELVGFD